jgi:hypothetical protein
MNVYRKELCDERHTNILSFCEGINKRVWWILTFLLLEFAGISSTLLILLLQK